MERMTYREADRLAAYEDTGLTPEDLDNIISEYTKFKEAEADGRLVMLPYGPGDTLFYTLGGEILELTVSSVDCVIRRDGRAVIISAMFARGGETTFTEDNFGKTVFFTREEAEAALAKEGGRC